MRCRDNIEVLYALWCVFSQRKWIMEENFVHNTLTETAALTKPVGQLITGRKELIE